MRDLMDLQDPPFKMTVAEAARFIGPNGAGLGTLIGVVGELTFITERRTGRVQAFVTKKDGRGGQVTAPADPEEEVHFVQGASFNNALSVQLNAASPADLKRQIRVTLKKAGQCPANFAARFFDASFAQATLRTVDGEEDPDGLPHLNIQSIIKNQASWTDDSASRLYSGFITNAMSSVEADAEEPYCDAALITASYDGYLDNSLLHMHVVGGKGAVDMGGHVLDFKGFSGMVEIIPYEPAQHLITFKQANGRRALRPAFSLAETQEYEWREFFLADPGAYIERRCGENALCGFTPG